MSLTMKKTGVREVLETLLVEDANPTTGKMEQHHPTEWARIKERAGPLPKAPDTSQYDKDFPPLPGQKVAPPKNPGGKTPMHRFTTEGPSKTQPELPQQGQRPPPVPFNEVHVQTDQWSGGAEARLRIERESTSKMRANMTKNVNGRTGTAKQGVENNCKMAMGLTTVLQENPALLEDGGLLGRLVGTTEGQGQHSNRDPKEVIESITNASKRLAEGKGEKDDANKVMQFIGCFVDGLTEVLEPDKDKAKQQFEKMWPSFQKAFGLQEGDKKKLLERVDGYKEIAGGVSDTLGGKGTRKGDTRSGIMTNDPRYKLEEQSALIKGDISGSMHSQLLAQELAETLMGGKGIKDKGDSVLVTDKKLLDARATDALALTAGGQDGTTDKVFHTAWEMINGMQAITGAPKVTQPIATEIMDLMSKGSSFTDAMEKFYKPEELPWLAKN